jgi:glycosyltransferase involved in cell wall biosynthesis
MLTIDARWMNESGIGTYLRHVVPGIIKSFPDQKICLLGEDAALKAIGWLDYPNVYFVSFRARMYSVEEQWKIVQRIPQETTLLFYPHYNIPLFYRGRVLVMIHDLCHRVLPQEGNFLKYAYARLLFGAVGRRAEAVITNSHFTKDEFLRHTIERAQPVFPIHLGVSEDWFAAAAMRANASSTTNIPYVLYIGNIKPHKNLGGLIRAWRSMKDVVPHKLIVVGRREGFITGDNRVQAEAAELGDRVSFTGYIDDLSLKRLVANAEALVLPSFYEGFGLPPLEAMAAGCPVAVSDIPALREVCGDAAVYFDPNNADEIASRLGELLLSHQMRERLRTEGLARAREFQWEACVSRTCDVIRQML